MATADQVKALVNSHGDGDDSRFYSVALQVAAKAARSGQTTFAQELRDLVDARRRAQVGASRGSGTPVPVARPRGELAELLTVGYPETGLADLALAPDVRERIDRVVLEQRQQDRLRAHGFEPMRRLLLTGPPGTGKTMTARALAGELRLPLFTVRLDGLITKLMGETAAKLRLIFDSVAETRGVYLFDEVDALAGERALGNDVGEIRRVLNSFLQFLEQHESQSLLVAASNHPQLLDRALFRRFDLVVEYPLPTPNVVRTVISNRLASMVPPRWPWKAVEQAANGLSQAEITVACEFAAKAAILAGETTASSTAVIAALRDRHRSGDGND
ncbi:AAA family ATPase [Actinoplanes derwentensis]|uniref:ATPase family associated with various cellular activities (AAA) n=1 Tax=Actinoplanes derwentensis TaxID=113562 RepID=A0A1H2DC05_9ACTN|nr:ATP-binding protein [Actinoplanes derwentensis]GID87483.1 ATPase [Actinoplanes derwentensis]SDT80263.1 ATPase family associated with various cellular activities (AAA) [Actinoplanes derwentensis]